MSNDKTVDNLDYTTKPFNSAQVLIVGMTQINTITYLSAISVNNGPLDLASAENQLVHETVN